MPNFKVGQDLYSAYFDDETGKCELDLYKVRTIRGGMVHAVRFIKGMTWKKKSTKHGGFGWSDSIPSWCKTKCRQGEKFAYLFTTKRQAWHDELKDVERTLKLKGDYALTDVQKVIHEKGFATLKRMVKKCSKK